MHILASTNLKARRPFSSWSCPPKVRRLNSVDPWRSSVRIPAFAEPDRISAAINRRMGVMLHNAEHLLPDPACDRDRRWQRPAGLQGYSFISTTSGNGVCGTSVEMTSRGPRPETERRFARSCPPMRTEPELFPADPGKDFEASRAAIKNLGRCPLKLPGTHLVQCAARHPRATITAVLLGRCR